MRLCGLQLWLVTTWAHTNNIWGDNTNFGYLGAWKVENSLQFLDFTTMAHYITYGGLVPNNGEAKWPQIWYGTFGYSYKEGAYVWFCIVQLFGFSAHSIKHLKKNNSLCWTLKKCLLCFTLDVASWSLCSSCCECGYNKLTHIRNSCFIRNCKQPSSDFFVQLLAFVRHEPQKSQK